MPKQILRTPHTRVFTIDGGAGPAVTPQYQGYARAGGVDWPQGDVTPVYAPSQESYDQFDIIDTIQGQQGLPALPIMFRSTRDLSDVLRLVEKRCTLDVQIHMGACKDPSDFNGGWELVGILEGALPTGYSTDDLGAMDSGGNAPVTETLNLVGRRYYQVKPLAGTLQAASLITDEVADVVICDSKTCGECGIASDGCQIVFAVIKDSTGSPGVPAELIWTRDGGGTWNTTTIDSMSLTETPAALACVGTYLVCISTSGDAYHYVAIADILAGTDIWTKSTATIVAAGSPLAIFSLGRTKTWLTGEGGYIYFASDITGTGFAAQTSGDVTAQNLTDIHGIDDQNLIACGASNALLVTANGGNTWRLVTGPAAGVTLQACWMRSQREWMVGTAGGRLYYTRDAGVTWTEKTFPGSAAGRVWDIAFPRPSVGYMSHQPASGSGRILRTIDGGASWYALPEGAGTIPSSSYLSNIAACEDNPNVLFAGGLDPNNNDGVLVKLA